MPGGGRHSEGMVLVSAMHISASVFVNDHEPGLWEDILDWLEGRVAPWSPDDYRHNSGTGEDNAAAHLRSLTVGHEVIVPVTKGSWISARGSACSTASGMDSGRSGSSSRPWESELNDGWSLVAVLVAGERSNPSGRSVPEDYACRPATSRATSDQLAPLIWSLVPSVY